jgi:hypothetical protein
MLSCLDTKERKGQGLFLNSLKTTQLATTDEKNSKVTALPYFLKHLFIFRCLRQLLALLACFLLNFKKGRGAIKLLLWVYTSMG